MKSYEANVAVKSFGYGNSRNRITTKEIQFSKERGAKSEEISLSLDQAAVDSLHFNKFKKKGTRKTQILICTRQKKICENGTTPFDKVQKIALNVVLEKNQAQFMIIF